MSDPLIKLDDVHKTYKLGDIAVPALRGLSLELTSGAFTALVGASGSGKSTVLNLVGCIDHPDRGSVYLEGVDVSLLSDDKKSELRNDKIGFIFQSFNLVPVLDVYENVELPLLINGRLPARDRRDRVCKALEDVGLAGYLRHLPDKLSGGQRQRVAIARALANNPSVILADEPTANLDSKTAHAVVDLMQDLNERRGVTFLFSTHDEKLISRVKRVLRITDGAIDA
jgi:putative ABC transport system ATP-binding protein